MIFDNSFILTYFMVNFFDCIAAIIDLNCKIRHSKQLPHKLSERELIKAIHRSIE